MKNHISLYPLRRIHGIFHEWIKTKKERWRCCTYLSHPSGHKCYILGTPQHTNLGDSAIVLAEILFLEKCGIEKRRIKEITTEEFKQYKDIVKKRIGKSDIVMLHGGGNMGDQWISEELLRRDMLNMFEKNRIILFPQTLYYSNTNNGQCEEKKSIPYYNRRNITIVAREHLSYRRIKDLYPNSNVLITPDIVLSVDKGAFSIPEQTRKGVLLCLRSDVEKAMSPKEHKEIEAFLLKQKCCFAKTDMYSDCAITKKNRKDCIRRKMNEFATAELIITDRLHGMIFAAITETPCIVFSNCNHKVEGTYEWIKYLPYIRFVNSVEEMEKVFSELISMENCKYDNTLLRPYFTKLAKAIKSRKIE